jgi:trigger factor
VFEALKGKKAGEEVSVEVANERKGAHGNVYSAKDTWDVKVQEVFRWNEPAIDDAWVKENLDIDGGVEEYRQKVEESAKKESADEKRFAGVHALYTKLGELNPVDPPKSFTERRYLALAESEMRRMAYLFGGRPMPMSDRQREMIWIAADFDIKRAFIDQAVAKKEGIEASDADVDAEIARLAEERGRKPLAIRAELERHKQLGDLADSLKRKKVEEFLFAKNEVSYVEPKDDEGEGEAKDGAAAS